MLPWKLRKCQILPVNQNLSSVYFSLAKFQLVSCHVSLAMIWQMTYTHKLPKLCSPTNNTLIFNMKLFQSSINSIDKLNFPVMLHQKAMHYRRKNYGQKHYSLDNILLFSLTFYPLVGNLSCG